jgi:hypothetical protein
VDYRVHMAAQVKWMSSSRDGDRYSNNSPKVRILVCFLLLSYREGGNDVLNVQENSLLKSKNYQMYFDRK